MTVANKKEKVSFLQLNLIRAHKLWLRLRNRNQSPTIISNNCIAGIIYSDLGLKFNSPTINLSLAEDYNKFLRSLEYYVHCVPEPLCENSYPYPVGVLRKGNEEVKIHFIHYSSFEEARDKWVERGQRVDLENLYVIWEHHGQLHAQDETVKQFKSLDFLHKRLLTDPVGFADDEVISMNLYGEGFYPGKTLKYQNRHSGKRFLDRFDYVRFLNTK